MLEGLMTHLIAHQNELMRRKCETSNLSAKQFRGTFCLHMQIILNAIHFPLVNYLSRQVSFREHTEPQMVQSE